MGGKAYDPQQHAERIGVRVEYRRGLVHPGLWVPDHHTIYLRAGMTSIHERSVLAHELGHVCLGHRTSTPKHELQADRWAVRRLIDPDELRDVAAASPDPGVWCHALRVSADLIDRWLADNRPRFA